MKISILFGYILGIAVILITVLTKEDTSYFIDAGALLITLGGTCAALMIHFSPKDFFSAFSCFFKLFTDKEYKKRTVINKLVEISRTAKSSSISSALQADFIKDNAFLEKGLMLVADGEDPSEIEEFMMQESITITETHSMGEKVFKFGGSIAPQFGMMGTIIGLIAMLNRVEDPATIPAAMGLALVTTLYGLVLSALFFKPTAGKIRVKNQHETSLREIYIQGVLSIQKGDSPQITKEKLMIFL